MGNKDLDDVRLHTTQAIEAVERSYGSLSRKKRLIIKAVGCLIFFATGVFTSNIMNSVPSEGTIEKVAAQPDLPNKCKYRYDRAMEYAIMHECVFSKGTPSSTKQLIQRINYCTCALESVQKKKPYQKMFENNLVDFTFKIREEDLCQESKSIPTLDDEPAK
ncbi:MAG: hypothetical protein HUK20_03765 [Fibrobacter sp.]|nr:hypothetical protein [Fibrobacter sp.]